MDTKNILKENRKLLELNEKLQKKVLRYEQLRTIVCDFVSESNDGISKMREFIDDELK